MAVGKVGEIEVERLRRLEDQKTRKIEGLRRNR